MLRNAISTSETVIFDGKTENGTINNNARVSDHCPVYADIQIATLLLNTSAHTVYAMIYLVHYPTQCGAIEYDIWVHGYCDSLS